MVSKPLTYPLTPPLLHLLCVVSLVMLHRLVSVSETVKTLCRREVNHTLRCCRVQELRNDAELQEGNLGWLKARMAVLIEICADSDAQRQGSALSKLSSDFKGLLASLSEVGVLLTCSRPHIPSGYL